MANKTRLFLASVAGFALMVGILLASISICSFQPSFFRQEFEQQNLSEVTKMSVDDMVKATKQVLAYTQGKANTIQVTATIDGTTANVFNQREIDHMVDVRALYQHAQMALWLCSGLVIAIGFYLYASKPVLKEFCLVLRRGFTYALRFLGVCLLCLGLWIVVDFYGFWTMFHEVFFRNDLWLLDPNTSLMINMYTETLFEHLVIRITLMTIVGWLLSYGVLYVVGRRNKK